MDISAGMVGIGSGASGPQTDRRFSRLSDGELRIWALAFEERKVIDRYGHKGSDLPGHTPEFAARLRAFGSGEGGGTFSDM